MVFSHYDTEEDVAVEINSAHPYVLMLHNDDVNTFNHVIESLVEICQHELTQAEQVAWIVHTKGKCDVKRGSFDHLESMCLQLLDRKLSVTIEQ